jgi:hypothetical protein
MSVTAWEQGAHRMRTALPLGLRPEQSERIVWAIVLKNNRKGAVSVAALQILLVGTEMSFELFVDVRVIIFFRELPDFRIALFIDCDGRWQQQSLGHRHIWKPTGHVRFHTIQAGQDGISSLGR